MVNPAPLADRIRPSKLQDFIGQEHLVGKGKPISLAIKRNQIFSMLFWGPPGCGKTTLARVIASETKNYFVEYSAVNTKLAEVRKVVKEAKARIEAFKQKTILFIDEIHRFNKAQQDAFLPHVEKGEITLIGATTENPSFEVIGPLLSRCQVFVLYPLKPQEIKEIIKRGLKELKFRMEKKAEDFLIDFSVGDARIALNAIEIVASVFKPREKKVTLELLREALQKKSLLYDRLGEEHYNTISAFIKSMRASNPDAALYYLARMVEAGEDPLFIARRMVIFASEDIGMAQPTALVVANEVFRACDTIGYPECAINLAHGVVYLCKAPKDRSAYNGLRAAQADVRQYGNLPIPLHLRNPVTKLMKKVGYGKGYEMYPEKGKKLLPDKLKGREYYRGGK